MGLFDKNKTEIVEEDTMECNTCSEEYKESELDEYGDCKSCIKKKLEKENLIKTAKKTYNYTFAIEFCMNSEGDEEDPLEYKGLTLEDAQKLYDNAKIALKNKEEYFEIPLIKQYDEDEEIITENYPEYVKLGRNVKRIYYDKDGDE